MKNYLVVQWIKNSTESVLYRHDNKSEDFIKGFEKGLKTDSTTKDVHVTVVM